MEKTIEVPIYVTRTHGQYRSASWQSVNLKVPTLTGSMHASRAWHTYDEYAYGGLTFDLEVLKYFAKVKQVIISGSSIIGSYGIDANGLVTINDNVPTSKETEIVAKYKQTDNNRSVYIVINETEDEKIKKSGFINTSLFLDQNTARNVSISTTLSASIICYALTPFPPTSLTPDDVIKQPLEDINLSWLFNLNIVENVELDIFETSEIWYQKNDLEPVLLEIDDTNYIFPAEFFENDDIIIWKVRTKAKHNGWSDWSEIATFKCGKTPPDKPILIYPLNTTVIGGSDIGLEYRYKSGSDNESSGFDIEYRKESIADIISGHTTETIFLIPSTNVADIVYWRVRAYNKHGESGDWSDWVNFIIGGKPLKPTITNITNSSQPIVTWNAFDTNVYKIEVRKHDEIVYKTDYLPYQNDNRIKIEEYLSNGQYLFRIKIKNTLGFESDYGELAFTINLESSLKPVFYISSKEKYCINVILPNLLGKLLLYRDDGDDIFKFHKDVTGLKYFEDYKTNSQVRYKYFIRYVSEGGAFADSVVKSRMLYFEETILSEFINLNKFIKIKYNLNDSVKKSVSFTIEKELISLAGRKYPVVEFGENKETTINISAFLFKNDFEKFLKLEDKVCYVRDKDLGNFECIINDIKKDKTTHAFNGYEVSFTLIRLGEIN